MHETNKGEGTELAEQVLLRLRAWAQRFPAMEGKRLDSMARSCAEACPGARPESVLQLAIFCMVLFGIDDLADRALGPMSDEEIGAHLRQFARLVRDGGLTSAAPPPHAPGQVHRALAEFCRSLPHDRPAYALFTRHLTGMLVGMEEEVAMSRAFAERGELPDWDSYVEMGTRTVGIPPVGAVLLALEGPAEPVLDERVEQLLSCAARCIRFANDLRSYAREVTEGKPNSISLLMRARAFTEAQARAAVAAARDAESAQLPGLVAALPAELRPWGDAFHRYTTFIRDWYAVAELHEAVQQLPRVQPVLNKGGTS